MKDQAYETIKMMIVILEREMVEAEEDSELEEIPVAPAKDGAPVPDQLVEINLPCVSQVYFNV